MSKRDKKFYNQNYNEDEDLTMAERGAYELNGFLQPKRGRKNKRQKRPKRVSWLHDDSE